MAALYILRAPLRAMVPYEVLAWAVLEENDR